MAIDSSPPSTKKDTHFDMSEANLTDAELEAAHGASALTFVKIVRLQVGPKSIQDGLRLHFIMVNP